jgi:hypothetical protein
MNVTPFRRKNTLVLKSYGIHADQDGLYWIAQGGRPTNAVGQAKSIEITVVTDSGIKHCNHKIAPSSPVVAEDVWRAFLSIIDHPLVRAFFPVPCGSAPPVFVPDQSRETLILLKTLSRLTSPIWSIVEPWKPGTARQALAKVRQSNVQPLVLTDVDGTIGELLCLRHPEDRFILTGTGCQATRQTAPLST